MSLEFKVREQAVGGVIQDWVLRLGLRHQGVLMTAVRGLDTSPKEDPVKALVRVLRGAFLNCFCGDPAKARSFIETVEPRELFQRMKAVTSSFDHLPTHYLLHLMHAAEVIGYKHPDETIRGMWFGFYNTMCHKLHLNRETEEQLDARLNATEETFGVDQ